MTNNKKTCDLEFNIYECMFLKLILEDCIDKDNNVHAKILKKINEAILLLKNN